MHDTYDDDSGTLQCAANLGKNTARRSKYRHVENIVVGIRKIDEHFSDKA